MNDSSELSVGQLEQLRSALELLAADPKAQMDHLEALGTAPSLDELALEFEDVRELVPGLVRQGKVPQELEQVVAKLDARIQEMGEHPELWRGEAIDRPQWQSIRALGKQAVLFVEQREG